MSLENTPQDTGPAVNPDQKFIDFFTQKYGWMFEKSPYSDIPTPQEKYISRSNQFAIDEIVKQVCDRYIIIDHFGDDENARTHYREHPPEDEREFVRWVRPHSKLPINHLQNALMSMQSITEDLPAQYNTKKKELEKMISDDLTAPFQLSESGGLRYRKMSVDERIAYARKVDGALVKFLAALS